MHEFVAVGSTLATGPPASALARAAANYWRESRRPLASLAFILPLLGCYELGVAALGASAVRNGVDAWLRRLLDYAGFGQYFLLPALTVTALVAWHYTTREPWQISRRVLPIMASEAVMLAAALVGLGQLQRLCVERLGLATSPGYMVELSAGPGRGLTQAVGFLGAGCYEELLFRLLLLPAAVLGFKLLGVAPSARLAGGVLLTSCLFSAAHYIGPTGEAWNAYGFAFRFVAGVFFAVLFVMRGFGIAAATHALYDIFVGAF